MEPLRIHLLGGFLLERGSSPLPPIASLRGRSLLAYLALHRGRPIQRDLLAGLFWPDTPEPRARRRLSHTLWQIQDVVNGDNTSHIRSTPHTLEFDMSTPHWLDVAEFDESFTSTESPQSLDRAARLRRCVELYRGDFLAGHFDDWVIVEQNMYRQRFLTALHRLIGASKSAGAYDEALDFALRLTHHDPLNEEAHREVMRINVLLGNTAQAVEQFERIRSVLEDELAAQPSPKTVEIYEKILAQRRSGIQTPFTSKPAMLLGGTTEAPFVGRDDERRLVVDAMDRVLGGPGGVVMIEGEPGVGKTRLAFELADDAKWRGFDVAWGKCNFGAVRPFAPLVDVIGSLNPLRVEQLAEQIDPVWIGEAGRIANVFNGTATDSKSNLEPAEASERMIEALVQTIEALGRTAPHLIVIDDVQWADRDTLTVLRQAGSRLARSRILLVLIYRSEEARGDPEVWEALRDLDKGAGLGRAVLAPLSVFELDRMVKRILGTSGLEPSVATSLHRQTGGNVLFTIETLLAMRDRGLFDQDVDPGDVLGRNIEDHDIPVAPRIRSIIESRLSLLNADVNSVFELVALIGHRITIELLEEVTVLDRPAVLHAMDELLYRGLVRDEGDGRYQVAHDQIRQVVNEITDPAHRPDMHRRIAAAISSLDPDHVEAIGHHFRAGGDNARATAALLEAGNKAVGLNAFATARHHYRSALEASETLEMPNKDRYQLLGLLFDVLNVLGRRDEQTELLEQMHYLAASISELQGDVARRRAWLLAHQSELGEAESSAELAVTLEESFRSTENLAASLIAVGTIRRWSGRPLEAIEPLTRAAQLSDSQVRRAEALSELASTLVEVHRIDEALGHLALASEIYTGTTNLRGQAEIAGIEARAMRMAGSRSRSIECYENAIELCRRIGYRRGEGLNHTNLSNLRQLMGEVASALSGYDKAAHIFGDLGDHRGEAMVLANSASARHNILGEDDRALVDALSAMGLFKEIGDRAGHAQCLDVVAGIEARSGDSAEARRLLMKSLEELDGVGATDLEAQHLRSLALLHIQTSDLTAAFSVLDWADELCNTAGLKDFSIEFLSIRAMAETARGNHDAGFEHARNAVENIGPGVERPYLLYHRMSLAAEAAHHEDIARSAAIEANTMLSSALEGLSPEQERIAIENVPEQKLIRKRAESLAPKTITVQLPISDAPTTRPLTDQEMRCVRWTVEHPRDRILTGDVVRRRTRVLRLLNEAEAMGARPSVEMLAKALAVSASTIRRDLDALRAQGHPARTRGQEEAAS